MSAGLKRIPINRLARVTLGKMVQPNRQSDADVQAPYLRAAHIQPNGRIIQLPEQPMWFSPKELDALSLKAGDVVVIEGGASGRSAFLKEDKPGWGFQNSIIRLRPIKERSDGRFLDYSIQSALANGEVDLVVGKATITHFTAEKVARFLIPAPPFNEQERIADYLDRETGRLDALVAEQENFIALLTERRTTLIDQILFSSSGGNESQANLAPLKRLVTRVEQGESPQSESGLADSPGSWGVLKSGCSNRGVFRPTEHKRLPIGYPVNTKHQVKLGDVIVSRASGTPDLVGSAAIVRELGYNLVLSDKNFRLIPSSGTDPQFLYWALNSRWYREQVLQSISGADGLANNLPLSALRNFLLPFPDLAEQQRIGALIEFEISRIDALIQESDQNITLSKERRAALITAAVTGQIEVG